MAIKCPKCQADNTDTARFCSNCATKLTPAGQPPAALTKTLETPTYALTKGSLAAGKYRILEEIGRGGMGVVYKAEDTKLARQVAIKVLPEIFTTDAERLARFEREARVLASINHPNIAAIYGVEEANGKRFLVLELVEGETLAERLAKGALSLEGTLDVCSQIAEGLEAAHEKGIIHRDLKPSNIKITPDGKVKILDFGLARAFHDQISEIDISKSPTITADMTRPGVILGTAAFMSPEQAKGKTVDKRVDIWAFGCILYECLSGRRAFQGETITETLAAILKGEPDWQALPADTPGSLRVLLDRCLQKDSRERLRDIGDARIEIETQGTYYPSETTAAPRRFSILWLAVGAAVMLLAGLFIDRVLIRRVQPAPSPSAVRAIIKVESGHMLGGMRDWQGPSRNAFAISSDGRFVIYSAVEENSRPQAEGQLYMRWMDRAEARPIAGTDGGFNPFLSPDNRSVGFWAAGKLKKIPIEGGVSTALCDVQFLFGANWDHANGIVFADGSSSGLSIISADGGKPESLTKPDPKREESSHRLPFWLPNGKAVLFTILRNGFDTHPRVALLRLDTRDWHDLIEDAADARYVPTGHLVFLRQGTIMAVRFDLANLEIAGQPVALVENVIQTFAGAEHFHTCAGQFGISDSGSFIYAAGGIVQDLQNSLVWVDQKGTEQLVMDSKLPFFAPRLSPDGQKIVYSHFGLEKQIWVYDLSKGTNSRLTGEGVATYAIWSPDGKRILFAWEKAAPLNLFWQLYDGSSPMERVTTSDSNQYPGSWSSDGKTVALAEIYRDNDNNIVVLDTRSGSVVPFLNSPFNEQHPELSPDGRWIAYTSNESKRNEIYVRPFPGPGMKYQVSSNGGREPLWARNGKQLFYRGPNQIWVVDVQTDGSFRHGKARLLFEHTGDMYGYPIRSYDLSLDSQRFLMVKFEQRKPTPVTEMILVQNWFEELKRLVPTRKK